MQWSGSLTWYFSKWYATTTQFFFVLFKSWGQSAASPRFLQVVDFLVCSAFEHGKAPPGDPSSAQCPLLRVSEYFLLVPLLLPTHTGKAATGLSSKQYFTSKSLKCDKMTIRCRYILERRMEFLLRCAHWLEIEEKWDDQNFWIFSNLLLRPPEVENCCDRHDYEEVSLRECGICYLTTNVTHDRVWREKIVFLRRETS